MHTIPTQQCAFTITAKISPKRPMGPVAFEMAGPYAGPERRRDTASVWTQAMLDELDYGILLLSPDRHLMLMNHAARAELDEAHPLQVFGRELRARDPRDVAPLHDALLAASCRGLRRLLRMGDGEHSVSLAVVPLPDSNPVLEQACMVTLGKRRVCQQLSVQWFAQCHGLTAAEARVLEVLCAGITPRAAALHLGVGLATVRTQIGCIRAKAGADSMRTLVQQVAKLPPMVSMLRASRSDGAAHMVLPLRSPHAEFQSSIARADRIGAAV